MKFFVEQLFVRARDIVVGKLKNCARIFQPTSPSPSLPSARVLFHDYLVDAVDDSPLLSNILLQSVIIEA